MIQSTLGHLQVNIAPQNEEFYKGLLSFLGWSVLFEEDGFVGLGDHNGASLWFMGCSNKAKNDYNGLGMNHLAISVKNQSDVDDTVAYLQQKNIPPLFETPRHRPEFCNDQGKTYYQVMFESPDRILFEVVYTGPLTTKI